MTINQRMMFLKSDLPLQEKYKVVYGEIATHTLVEIEYDGLRNNGFFKQVFFNDVAAGDIENNIKKFFTENDKFLVARASISENGESIQFINGRHRTRWLLDSGVTKIGVHLQNVDIDKLAIYQKSRELREEA